MADILTFNLTQVETELGTFKPRQMVGRLFYTEKCSFDGMFG